MTATVLRKINTICKETDRCADCPLDRLFCNTTPEHWTDKEIEEIADIIDDYEEEEE